MDAELAGPARTTACPCGRSTVPTRAVFSSEATAAERRVSGRVRAQGYRDPGGVSVDPMARHGADPSVSGLIGPEVRLGRASARKSEVCRCGTRLPAGSPCLVILNPPSSIEYLLSPRSFCSLRCARAFLLERLAEMEALSTPHAEKTISDLREAYLDLARALSDLRFDLTDPHPFVP
jgi:hypothetical protein